MIPSMRSSGSQGPGTDVTDIQLFPSNRVEGDKKLKGKYQTPVHLFLKVLPFLPLPN